MNQGFWKWAEQSPVIIAPIFAIFLALVFLPFAVAGTDKAAEFYGAFAAAIVAAIAVILGASYQAHLTRRRDDEVRVAELVVAAKEIFLWLDKSIFELERAYGRLDEFAARMKLGASPQFPSTYENFRVFFMPISPEEAEAKMVLLSKFPIDLALSISSAIRLLSSAYGAHNAKVLRDDTPVALPDVEYWARQCRNASAIFKVAQAQIANVMYKRYGAHLPMPGDLEEAAKRLQALVAET
jgi:hypothetical protein